jgi:transposase
MDRFEIPLDIEDVKIEAVLDCFDSFLSTLDKRLDEITNYFVARKNSGFVEGLNNKIKVIKRRCYGIFNVGHLFQRNRSDPPPSK